MYRYVDRYMYSCMILATIHCGIINQKFQCGMTRQPFKISYYQCFNVNMQIYAASTLFRILRVIVLACRSMQLLRYFVFSVLQCQHADLCSFYVISYSQCYSINMQIYAASMLFRIISVIVSACRSMQLLCLHRIAVDVIFCSVCCDNIDTI